MKIVNKLQKIENYTHFIYIYYYNKSLDIKIKNRNLKLIMSFLLKFVIWILNK